jgi:hypothetical protein
VEIQLCSAHAFSFDFGDFKVTLKHTGRLVDGRVDLLKQIEEQLFLFSEITAFLEAITCPRPKLELSASDVTGVHAARDGRPSPSAENAACPVLGGGGVTAATPSTVWSLRCTCSAWHLLEARKTFCTFRFSHNILDYNYP